MSRIGVISLLLMAIFVRSAHASNYVMPYPSYMPGHKLYKLHQIWETVQEYWHFGDLSKEKFHREMADKYIVEAKTLFDYGQHKLAVEALIKSNDHFARAILYLMDITHEKKDNGESKQLLLQSRDKHVELITLLDDALPDEIDWQEEKKENQKLPLHFLFSQSKHIRTYANL